MISTILPFSELLESVKIETGIENLRNLENKIKIMATDAEKKLGYNTALVLKKVTYEFDEVNYNGQDLWLPKDCWELSTIFDGTTEIDDDDYIVTGDYVYFRKDKEPDFPTVIYHAITHDGYGWPLMSRNHKDAITAYIVWKLITPKAFLSANRSDRALVKDYRQDWYDERDAAIGMDVMPGSTQQWEKLMSVWNSSDQQLAINEPCILHESEYALANKKECVLREIEKEINIYHWQFDDRTTNIGIASTIDQNYLDENAEKKTLEDFVPGITIGYNSIGRIAFAVQGSDNDEYNIYDILNSNVTNIVFDRYYNSVLKLDIFISKEFYSTSNIFFRFQKK